MQNLNRAAILRLPAVSAGLAPTPEDEALNTLFMTYIGGQCPEIPAPMAAKQKLALSTLYTLFKTWCGTEFHMFVSGSYRLGVHSSDADIDVLFVTTSAVSRKQIFTNFLEALHAHPEIADVQPIPNARVPIIGAKLLGQEFDILTCHLRVPVLPSREELLMSYEWMNGLEDGCILAFNGPRLTELILKSIPRPTQFCAALKFLRHWAKCRMIYSNKSGFLGGVNLALMLLYIAQRHPKAVAAVLITSFFDTFAAWKWSKSRPLILDDGVPHECPVWLQTYEWTPRHTEVMVLLTPCFPRFNTTFTASVFTAGILQREFQRGADMMRGADGFAAACGPVECLARCHRFIQVSVVAPATPAGKSWQGYVESQARFLVEYMSREELAIEEFRAVPQWCTLSTAAGTITRSMYVTAQDDGKIRTFLLKGTLEQPLEYFLTQHAGKGPPRPHDSTMSAQYCMKDELPDEMKKYVPSTSDDAAARTQTHSRHTRKRGSDCMTLSVFQAPVKRKPQTDVPGLQWTVRPSPKPVRITMRRPVWRGGVMTNTYDVYIGRTYTWQGKAFKASIFSVPDECVRKDRADMYNCYKKYAQDKCASNKLWARQVHLLKGKTLGCWCTDTQWCHGNILKDIAEGHQK